MTDDSNKKTKTVRVGFFTSNSAQNQGATNAKIAFDQIFSDANAVLPTTYTIDNDGKKLKFVMFERDETAKYYFGYVSCVRHSLLPFIEDGETGSERIIPLNEKDYVVERTYLLYYYETDVLVLSLNHLGPKVNDISYLLYKKLNQIPIKFEAIWKEDDMKELLEQGNVLRSCDLTIAAPRNFNVSNYDLSNNLSKDIVRMVVMGGTHLKLSLRGRARPKKDGFSYLSDTVRNAIKELLETFPKGSGGLTIKKAEVTEPSNTKPKSLLDQVLVSKKTINIIGGYPSDSDIRTAMISAKIDVRDYLRQYELQSQD
ncbi:Uncharacterised protein [Yersinia enterocolitica]|uniref:DUF6731 family protein n=1 Tax=Yersinia enterocolitica TaxID=630 RepID=UPI0005E75E3D|nr:DUF6731 family protein [Yersinia enterocolitica]CQD39704.1 Uncharacterised protein [Yersinia enterocolitica]CQH71696.1 Uncharacterised protein [Yersinia enterocolitica]CQQ79935.1 Uncharacterised protein [Yersinia enterocolitica]